MQPSLARSAQSSAIAAPRPTLLGALRNVATGLYNRTAKFANYRAAFPTSSTNVGSRIGTNPNSTFATMQRIGMNWTAEDVFKNCAIAKAYILQRINYCSALMYYVPATGDPGLDATIKEYLQGHDGFGGVFSTMGVDCSMQDAFSRTADIECPIRGDAGMILWREDPQSDLRLIEFSADQIGEVYSYVPPRATALARNSQGDLMESTGGMTCVYFAGRYMRGADCIAYKIYERTNSWYGSPRIYDASDVFYFRDPSSFRGVRGVTKFDTAILHMAKGEQLWQIGMDAAQRQARTAMIVTNERGMPDEQTYESAVDLNGQTHYRTHLPDGPVTEYFYNGDSASFVSPDSPGPELIQGVEKSDERVALALGLNYAFLIAATKVGGAPSRLEIEKADKELQRIQNKIHRPMLSRVRDVTLYDGARRGYLPRHPRLTRGRWVLPISASVDAFYEAKENIDMSREGFEAPQDIIAETNRDWEEVLEKRKQWAVKCAMTVEDSNNELKRLGYQPTVTIADVAQNTDNPQQAAAAENLIEGKSATGVPATARLSAFIGDVRVNSLPQSLQDEIGKHVEGNPLVMKYGMTVPELLSKADQHNLSLAQNHIRYCTNGSCSDEVHANDEKAIILMNDRIIDGHHFLAKAEKGKVSKSLQVVDLTPSRFQSKAA